MRIYLCNIYSYWFLQIHFPQHTFYTPNLNKENLEL